MCVFFLSIRLRWHARTRSFPPSSVFFLHPVLSIQRHSISFTLDGIFDGRKRDRVRKSVSSCGTAIWKTRSGRPWRCQAVLHAGEGQSPTSFLSSSSRASLLLFLAALFFPFPYLVSCLTILQYRLGVSLDLFYCTMIVRLRFLLSIIYSSSLPLWFLQSLFSYFFLSICSYGVYLSSSIALLFLYSFFYPANLCTFVLLVCCSYVLHSFLNRTASRRRGYFDPSFSWTVLPPHSKQHSKRWTTKPFNYFERYVAKNVMSYGSSRCGLRNIWIDWNVDRVKVVRRGWRPLICVEFLCIPRIRYV